MLHADAEIIARARATVAEVLRDEPVMLEHCARAAHRAVELSQRIPTSRPTDVIASAWLHDIGYAQALSRTGFHPLDGALFLMSDGWPERIVRLVAHHSLAALEAPFYGVGHHMGVIEVVSGLDADILAAADLGAGLGDPPPTIPERLDIMKAEDTARGLVPPEVCEARYAGLLEAHQRVGALL